MGALRQLAVLLSALFAVACFGPAEPPPPEAFGSAESALSAAERRTRAGQIRDAAFANGITQGWLLAGIADAETRMSHCWSELTWACQGPSSPDCGGGPVVAGAGDGPCSIRQGGLGMFQFDAGTFEDTLAREGDRVLRIDGNVAAAVDFTTNMVIRSAYVSGVSTRAQAVEWMNGVRIGNGRWDAWIRTVTHYYNGCAPSYSCFSSRYEHYRSNTVGVHDEMGAGFWAVNNDWSASFVAQSFPYARDPFEIPAGAEVAGHIELRNEGTQTWTPGATFLGTTQPRDVASPIAGSDWVSDHRAATVDAPTAPGEVGRFAFHVRAPDATGDYPQFFNLVQEGVSWFGSPSDDQLQVRVTSVANECGAVGGDWECDGSSRRRCRGGSLEIEMCADGCAGGVCAEGPSGPEDADGDGHNTSVDCDDTDASVYPGAPDPCGDGVDADCDGDDMCGAVTGPDGSVPTGVDAGVGSADDPSDPGAGPGTMTITGGCAAGGSGGAPLASLLLLGLLAIRRRR
jgi:uncharacterized protein (TIGR03382 family)